MEVKQILKDAYLAAWEHRWRASGMRKERNPKAIKAYETGLNISKIETFFTIDRIQIFVNDRINNAIDPQAEEAFHIENLDRLARIYARTLFDIVIKQSARYTNFNSVYEQAIISQREKYASNTYPCYRPGQKTGQRSRAPEPIR